MEDMFEAPKVPDSKESMPLAARMRPETLDEYVGQKHILGPGKLLRRAVEADRFSSILLYGPPGVGKTSLARVIANSTKSAFVAVSGVEGNVSDLRKAIATADQRLRATGVRTVLFVDEIHRFNKAQQDVLLPHVEQGTVRLIGATTHNPFFYVISPLISRSQIFQLEPLSIEDLLELIARAIQDKARGLRNMNVRIDDDAARHLAVISDGDARKCLSALEIAALTTEPTMRETQTAKECGPGSRSFSESGSIDSNSSKVSIPIDHSSLQEIHITLPIAEGSIQRKAIVYDADEDQHYDTISAFIKSMRGSDPDATLYWLAKMLHAGEDIRFIARRIVICASEDIGLADSQALLVAIAAQQAVEFVGLPEAQIPLAHAAVYLATAPKSNKAYEGLLAAKKDIQNGRTLAVPHHLRSSNYKGAATLGHGENYLYSHDYEGSYVPQAYLPEGRTYYLPTDNGQEKRIRERLAFWKAQFELQEKEQK